jgi:tetratricopeptide (TPR) repeat protein
MNRRVAVPFALLLALAPAGALAQISTAEEIAAVGGSQAARSLGQTLADGHTKYRAGDFQAALEAYLQIKDKLPGSAWIYLFIGTAQRAMEQWDEALASFKTTATIAGTKDVDLRAKALFNLAVTHEARAGEEPGPSTHWNSAKLAWAEYLDLARANPGAKVFPDDARARIETIEKRFALWEDYEQVRKQAKERGGRDD